MTKYDSKLLAIKLREKGYSINAIAKELGVAKSSVSLWVRGIEMTEAHRKKLNSRPFTTLAIEKRRQTRLQNEHLKRQIILDSARQEVARLTKRELWLMGVMLYWAEGGKTQRMVRFSNGDPRMIQIMMLFFRTICRVPEGKFRGYIHIHPHLDSSRAEDYWSQLSNIPREQFFKTYRKHNISSKNTRDTLPYGVMDIYVLDTNLFLKVSGWAAGIFEQSDLKIT